MWKGLNIGILEKAQDYGGDCVHDHDDCTQNALNAKATCYTMYRCSPFRNTLRKISKKFSTVTFCGDVVSGGVA